MIKDKIKSIIPASVLQRRRQKIAKRNQERFAAKTITETFDEIYAKNVWGGAAGEFYSGEGSTEKYSARYGETVGRFIAENHIKSVVDLGCGDFRVAAKFVFGNFSYTGVDVVRSLIERNRQRYANEKVEFRCLNIVEDELPDGELCLIRQVLQHLSNAEIGKILENCRKYKYLIVTEHYPHPNRKAAPNLDIPHGPEMRLHFDSAVYLDKPPFNLKNVSLLLDAEAEEGTRIKTFLVSGEQ